MRRSQGQTGATGCLRALTGGVHRASARAHPCSASLLDEPRGPELQQPPLCRVGDVAAPVVTAGLSPLRPVAAGGPSAQAHLWGPWLGCVPAEHLVRPWGPLCRTGSVQPVLCPHLAAEAAADGSQSKAPHPPPRSQAVRNYRERERIHSALRSDFLRPFSCCSCHSAHNGAQSRGRRPQVDDDSVPWDGAWPD